MSAPLPYPVPSPAPCPVPSHEPEGPCVVSVNLAVVRDDVYTRSRSARGSKPRKTGIDKRPAPGPVRLEPLGVVGDTICDTKHHGGPDQAVYAYALEDLDWWRAELGGEISVPVGPGSVGENLTTLGVDVTGAVIGERWRVGKAELEVSVPRIPCRTFQAYWGVERLMKRFTAAGRPGAYLRVLTAGDVVAGDTVHVVHRPDHGLTIAETFRALTGDRDLAAKLLSAPELPRDVHQDARTWLAGVR
ncbi:MOSC domain-containing protein [Jatrophihabitans telluris]|uniref:MOSC domain-containing protein n=1 Tax=Jatrophihabitans telluris TaxID=2038343 RepID=A0ABY4R1T8_9ACTN|nr:MOSC domain-containing protein [Jatrophihabitans telluris]UQX89116.1 MOSC domain-containing protein [Jatrophihabitans telluris]